MATKHDISRIIGLLGLVTLLKIHPLRPDDPEYNVRHGKAPLGKWGHLRLSDMTPECVESCAAHPGALGVSLGEASNGLTTFDIDSNDEIEPFLSLNPTMRNTTATRGARGGQWWFRCDGAYPQQVIQLYDSRRIIESGKFKGHFEKYGEFRSTGGQSLVSGPHPSGVNYQFSQATVAQTLSIQDTHLPPYVSTNSKVLTSWKSTVAQSLTESYQSLTQSSHSTRLSKTVCPKASDSVEETVTTTMGQSVGENAGESVQKGVGGSVGESVQLGDYVDRGSCARFIDRFIPYGTGLNNDLLFSLARQTIMVEASHRVDRGMVFDAWMLRSRQFLKVGTTEDDALACWERALKSVEGDFVTKAWRKTQELEAAGTQAPGTEKIRSAELKKLALFCWVLQQMTDLTSPGSTWHLSCRTVGLLFGIPHEAAARWMKDMLFERYNVLLRIEKGVVYQKGNAKSGQAARYRYIGGPQNNPF